MTTYYVNKSGNDSNSGLDENNAKLTIGGGVVAASSGDTIKVQSGVYYETVGASGKSLVFQADGYVVIDGGNTRSYGFSISVSEHIRIYDFEVRNCTSWGIYAYQNASNRNNYIYRNKVYDNANGIYSRARYYGYYYDNVICDNAGTGFYFNQGSQHPNYFRRNLVYGNGGTGFYFINPGNYTSTTCYVRSNIFQENGLAMYFPSNHPSSVSSDYNLFYQRTII